MDRSVYISISQVYVKIMIIISHVFWMWNTQWQYLCNYLAVFKFKLKKLIRCGYSRVWPGYLPWSYTTALALHWYKSVHYARIHIISVIIMIPRYMSKKLLIFCNKRMYM